MDDRRPRTDLKFDRTSLLIASFSGYFLLAVTTICLTSDGRNHATVWPADAITLALLLLTRRRQWPGIIVAGWLANFLANGLTRDWAPGIVIYGAINMAQASLAALMLRRWVRGDDLLSDTTAATRFLLIAGLLAPALGATLGSLTSLLNYGEPFGPSFIRWYGSNALGLVICTPFFKAVFDGSYGECFRQRSSGQILVASAHFVLHIGVAVLVFAQSTLPLLFLPLSTLLLLAFREGRLGAMAGVILLAVIGAIAAYAGEGPLALIDGTPMIRAIFFQAYLGTILCTTLPVAAAVSSLADALKRLAEHRLVLQQILAHSPDGVLSFDEHGVCRWADGRLEEQLGLEPGEVIGMTAAEIGAASDMTLAQAASLTAQSAGAPSICEIEPVGRPGTILEATTNVLASGPTPTGVVITLHDITLRKSREAAYARDAETDDLTGVFNRKGFRRRLLPALDQPNAPVALALIDVDHFKSINDRFGHAVGDEVLAEVASRLATGVRNTDTVGRLGGDEFAILFRCDLTTAQAACERIAALLRGAAIANSGNATVMASISCGVAEFRIGMTRGQLFDAADTALYEVKRAGRNGVRAAA